MSKPEPYWLFKWDSRRGQRFLFSACGVAAGAYVSRWWLRRVFFAVPNDGLDEAHRVGSKEVHRERCQMFKELDVVVRYHTTNAYELSWPQYYARFLREWLAGRPTPESQKVPSQKFASMTLEPSADASSSSSSSSFLRGMLDRATDQTFVRCASGYRSGGLDAGWTNRTCLPDTSVLCANYLRVMFAAFAMLPFPLDANLNVAQLGVAGGALPGFIQHYLTSRVSQLDLVDIEPAASNAALRHMGLDGDRMLRRCTLHVVDAEDYLLRHTDKLDVLFVDLYEGSTLSPLVRRHSFIDLCRVSLRKTGVVAFNLPSSDPFFYDECAAVFGKRNVLVAPVPRSSNVVVLAARDLPEGASRRHIVGRASELSRSLHLPYDIGAHLPMLWAVW
jgi:spermidine synthase